MALVVGNNSWETITEADTYLTNRVGAESWFNLADTGTPGADSKTTFLVSAFYWLYNSSLLDISKSVSDDQVKNAQSEAALFLLNNYAEYFERRGVLASGLKSLKLDLMVETYDNTQLSIPSYILGMLAEYNAGNTFVTVKGEYDV